MNESLPIVAVTGDPSLDALRQAVRYLIAYKVEIRVQPPDNQRAMVHRWVVNERFPKGSWEIFAERKFTHAAVDNKQLNRVVASTEDTLQPSSYTPPKAIDGWRPGTTNSPFTCISC